MAIRPAVETDLPALLPLIRAYCEFYEADPPGHGIERMARAVIAAPAEEAFLLVATADAADGEGAEDTAGERDAGGEVIGFAACGWKWSSLRGARIVVLEDLFVAAGARGAGHADALIAACADLARRHGAPALTWLTAPDNRRAQAVYDRVGGHAAPFLEYELEL